MARRFSRALPVLLSLFVCVGGASQALYSADDPIVQLDVASFSRTLTDSDTAWIVEFYATWCGHCHRFAPVYKQFAADIQDWSGVIRVAAVACSDPRNQPVCRQQDVRGYPTIKFFPPNLSATTRGFKLNSLRYNADSVRNTTIDFIEEYIEPSAKRPYIKRYSTLHELRTPGAWLAPRHVLAIVDEESASGDILSKQVILDVSGLRPDVTVGRILRSSLPDPSLIWQPLPALVAVGENSVRYITQVTDRDQTVDMINSIASGPPIPHHINSAHSPAGGHVNPGVPLQPAPQEVPLQPSPQRPPGVPLQPSPQQPPGVPLRPSQGVPQTGHLGNTHADEIPPLVPLVTHIPTSGPHHRPTHGPQSPNDVNPLPPMVSPTHQTLRASAGQSSVMGITQNDLDSNLFYSLWNEVPSRRSFRSRSLAALKEYAQLLQQHHPGNERTRSFLSNLNNWLQRIGGSMSSEVYINTIDGLQTSDSYIVKDLSWRTCAGSEGRYRGYPCSMWMTFHALTVSAYKQHLQNPTERFDPLDVLNVIRDYVKYFFRCRECAEHFLAMSKRMRREVNRPQDGVLWLWRAHNQVNNRLHGDATEDPSHPKVQFPGEDLCPTCRVNNLQAHERYDNDTIWNEEEVLKFLMSFYSTKNESSWSDHRSLTVQQRPITTGVSPIHAENRYTGASPVTRSSGTTPPDVNTSVCDPMETPWSKCSVTCGVGVSTRFTNHNSDCQMRLDLRICTLRKCDRSLLQFISNTGMSPTQCSRYASSVLETSPRPLTFNNCTTTTAHKWRYCGLCRGYCCDPVDSDTLWLDMTCEDGTRGQAQFMWINKCKCRGGSRRKA